MRRYSKFLVLFVVLVIIFTLSFNLESPSLRLLASPFNAHGNIVSFYLELPACDERFVEAGDTITINWHCENTESWDGTQGFKLYYSYSPNGYDNHIDTVPTSFFSPHQTEFSYEWQVPENWSNKKNIWIDIKLYDYGDVIYMPHDGESGPNYRVYPKDSFALFVTYPSSCIKYHWDFQSSWNLEVSWKVFNVPYATNIHFIISLYDGCEYQELDNWYQYFFIDNYYHRTITIPNIKTTGYDNSNIN